MFQIFQEVGHRFGPGGLREGLLVKGLSVERSLKWCQQVRWPATRGSSRDSLASLTLTQCLLSCSDEHKVAPSQRPVTQYYSLQSRPAPALFSTFWLCLHMQTRQLRQPACFAGKSRPAHVPGAQATTNRKRNSIYVELAHSSGPHCSRNRPSR